MKVVCNSSPLIHLARVGKLELLKNLFQKTLVPAAVYREVVEKGLAKRFPDATGIAMAFESGWLEVADVHPMEKLEQIANELQSGETEVISLAKKVKADLVLLDDDAARSIAESYGLEVHSTIHVILLAQRKKIISREDALEIISNLISSGLRISPEVYAEALKQVEKT